MKKLIEWFKRLFGKVSEPVVLVAEPPKAQKIPELPADVLSAAYVAVGIQMAVDASGEYKRHFVLSELMKKFPETDKKILCLSIELAIWRMDGFEL